MNELCSDVDSGPVLNVTVAMGEMNPNPISQGMGLCRLNVSNAMFMLAWASDNISPGQCKGA